MSKEYRYRKFIRWGQYVIAIIFGILVLVMAVSFGTLLFNTDGEFLNYPVFLLIIPFAFTILFGLEGFFLWYLYYRLAGVVLSLDDNGVVYKYRGGIKHFPFESVRVNSASIRYTGGWLKLISGKDVVRITVVMENISEFVQEIKTALDSRGLSNHYDAPKLFGFMKTAAASDQSWERMYAIFGKLNLIILVVAITVANGYVFGTLKWGFIWAIGWGIFSMFWATGAYTIAEIFLMRKIAEESNNQAFTFPQRDLAYEKQVYNKAINWGGWLYVLVSVLVLLGVLAFKMILIPLF